MGSPGRAKGSTAVICVRKSSIPLDQPQVVYLLPENILFPSTTRSTSGKPRCLGLRAWKVSTWKRRLNDSASDPVPTRRLQLLRRSRGTTRRKLETWRWLLLLSRGSHTLLCPNKFQAHKRLSYNILTHTFILRFL